MNLWKEIGSTKASATQPKSTPQKSAARVSSGSIRMQATMRVKATPLPNVQIRILHPDWITGRSAVQSRLRGGDAVEIEAEESVGIGIEADLGVGWIGGAGRAGVGARKTLRVDADVHGLHGAEGGIDEEGDGHGIEEGGGFLAPLVVEESEGVGDGGALAKEEGALNLVELELGGVEGHDEEGHACGEEFLRGGDVIEDVPFGLRGCGRAEAEVAVAALDGATHQDDALQLAEGGGVFVDGGADVHEGADGDERDLAGVAADLVEEEGDGVGVGGLGEVAGFGVVALGEVGFGRQGYAGGYRDFGAAGFGEEAVEELG